MSDQYNHTIRRISPQGEVTTVAGAPGSPGSADGNGSAARFNYPCGLTYDATTGAIFIADYGNHTIPRLDPQFDGSGTVSAIAGAVGVAGNVDGPATSARFWQPLALSFDRNRNLYITDVANTSVRKLTFVRTPTVSTIFSLAPPIAELGGR